MVRLLGVTIVDLPAEAIVHQIERALQQRQKSIFQYINMHAINLAQDLPWFKAFINQATIPYCDGYGVLWAARLSGASLRYRSTPPDWIDHLASMCCRCGYSLFLLGGKPGVAEKAGKRLLSKHPDLQISGHLHGYFDKAPGCPENDRVIQAINAAQTDILVVGMGMPVQERWLMENWPRLDVQVALPVGSLLDYLAGVRVRFPAWMTNRGLEWLGRLVAEPRRLWKRYLLGIPRIFFLVLRQRLFPS